MNEELDEVLLDILEEESEDALLHYGMPRRSGRYPWGSGENPYQHSGDFLARVNELKEQGMTETQIAESIGLTTTQLRAQVGLANYERRSELVARAESLRSDGYSLNEIAKMMGYENDSSVRSLLDEKSKNRMNTAIKTAEFLKKQVDEKGMIDVGTGVENDLGNISREKLNQALYILEMEGYNTYGGGVPQVNNPGKQTNIKVLCPPGYTNKDIYDFDNVHSIRDYVTTDGGDTFRKAFEYPESLDSKRLSVRYAEDGGKDKDGLIEIRRGVQDLDLGEAHYAQVRIMVDGTHYIKGMAVYSDDLPEGVDVIFNTNKTKDVPVMGAKDHTVLKNIKSDPNNPFGSLIKEHGGQSYYDDPNGKFVDANGNHQSLSLINKRAEEGDWGEWSKELSAQFLSKQPISLIKKQLELSEYDKESEYKDILSVNNPTVKKKLLQSFADDCDAAAVHLKAAALPRQQYQVIIPVPELKDTEIYAPNYRDGEEVVLIRYPHGGTFEIPKLKVNNKQKQASKVLGNALDAVGINSTVAEKLSGADFDGDTVLVIPVNKNVNIKSTPSLQGLKGFDPKVEYGGKPEGTYQRMHNTQNEMGRISNLITDMTLKGATEDELARAVRHSMVVIDAEKHGLDYKQSEKDNGIKALKAQYQGSTNAEGKYSEGSATLISRSKSPQQVLKRVGSPKVNQKGKEWYDPSKPEGALVYKEVVETYKDPKTGKEKIRTQDSTKMAETTDARTLSSGTKQEELYANYANKLKSLANEARLEILATGKIAYSASAKETYAKEVSSLMAQLNVAEKNKPVERQAQLTANAVLKAKVQSNPDLTNKEKKKIAQQALTEARNKLGAHKEQVKISDKEWEAIQSGAISESVLKRILDNADMDVVKNKATPLSRTTLSPAKISKLKSMMSSGNYTASQIAEALGVSVSTVNNYTKDLRNLGGGRGN